MGRSNRLRMMVSVRHLLVQFLFHSCGIQAWGSSLYLGPVHCGNGTNHGLGIQRLERGMEFGRVCSDLQVNLKNAPEGEEFQFSAYYATMTALPWPNDIDATPGFTKLGDLTLNGQVLSLSELKVPDNAVCGNAELSVIMKNNAGDYIDHSAILGHLNCDRPFDLDLALVASNSNLSENNGEVLIEPGEVNPFRSLGISSIKVVAEFGGIFESTSYLSAFPIFIGLYNDWDLVSIQEGSQNSSDATANQQFIDEVKTYFTEANETKRMFLIAHSDLLHTGSLFGASVKATGKLPNITKSSGLELDIEATQVPLMSRYMDVLCMKPLLVVVLDPFHEIPDQNRSNNILVFPISQDCNATFSTDNFMKVQDSNCLALPDYETLGDNAVLRNGPMETHGQVEFVGQKNGLRRLDRWSMVKVANLEVLRIQAKMMVNDVIDNCASIRTIAKTLEDSTKPIFDQVGTTLKAIVTSFENTNQDNQLDKNNLTQSLKTVSQTIDLVLGNDNLKSKLTDTLATILDGGGFYPTVPSHHPRHRRQANDFDKSPTGVPKHYKGMTTPAQMLAFAIQAFVIQDDEFHHWPLVPELSKCIRGMIWTPGQSSEGELCSLMSQELRSSWANLVSSIMKQQFVTLPMEMSSFYLLMNKVQSYDWNSYASRLVLPLDRSTLTEVLTHIVEALENTIGDLGGLNQDPSGVVFFRSIQRYLERMEDQAIREVLTLARLIQGEAVMQKGIPMIRGMSGENPSDLDVCELILGQTLAQKSKLKQGVWKDSMSQDSKSSSSGRTSLPVVWRTQSQALVRGEYNKFLGQWLWRKVAKCSCESEIRSGCPAVPPMGNNYMPNHHHPGFVSEDDTWNDPGRFDFNYDRSRPRDNQRDHDNPKNYWGGQADYDDTWGRNRNEADKDQMSGDGSTNRNRNKNRNKNKNKEQRNRDHAMNNSDEQGEDNDDDDENNAVWGQRKNETGDPNVDSMSGDGFTDRNRNRNRNRNRGQTNRDQNNPRDFDEEDIEQDPRPPSRSNQQPRGRGRNR